MAGRRQPTVDSPYSWVVLFAAFMMNLHFGFSVSHFGVFLVEFIEYFDAKKSSLMWIGALLMSTGFSLGNISGWIVQKYHCRVIGCACAALAFVSLLITAYTPNIGVLYFSVGVLTSISLSTVLLISTIATQLYFDKRRSLANGVAMSGLSAGIFIWPVVCRLLIDTYGWRGAMVILAALQLHIAVYAALIRPIYTKPLQKQIAERSNRQQEVMVEDGGSLRDDETSVVKRRFCGAFSLCSRCCASLWKPVIKHPEFGLLCFGMAFIQSGFLTFIIVTPIRAHKMGISKSLGSLLVSIMAIVSGVMRIIIGYIGDKPWANRFFIMSFASVLSGIVMMSSFGFTSFIHMACYSVFIGFPSAAMMSLMMPSIRDIVGLHLFPVATGTNSMVISFSQFFTLFLSGVLLDLTDDPKFSFLVFGCSQIVGGLCIIVVWQWIKRKRFRVPVTEETIMVDISKENSPPPEDMQEEAGELLSSQNEVRDEREDKASPEDC